MAAARSRRLGVSGPGPSNTTQPFNCAPLAATCRVVRRCSNAVVGGVEWQPFTFEKAGGTCGCERKPKEGTACSGSLVAWRGPDLRTLRMRGRRTPSSIF